MRDELDARQKRVTLYRRLAASDPRRKGDLAAALQELADQYDNEGRTAEAIAPAREAIQLRRESAQAAPTDSFALVGLVHSLHQLANWLVQVGEQAEADEAFASASDVIRQMVRVVPDERLPMVPPQLLSQAEALAGYGRYRDAQAFASAAVEVERRLVAKGGPVDELALAVSWLGTCLVLQARESEAVPVFEEAVAITRQLYNTEPGAHAEALAQHLDNLALALSRSGRHAEASAAADQAVALRS